MKSQLIERLLEMLLSCDDDSPKGAQAERAVVVCTEKRGVFFGYTTDNATGNVRLRKGRNCFYWAKWKGDTQHGVLGLASLGPQDGSKIGAPADIELTGVTLIADCTSDAAARWEAASWS